MNPRNESDTLILPHKEVVIIINEKQAFNLNSTSENLLVQRGAKSSFDDRQKSANNLSFEKLQEAKRKVYSMYNQNLQSFVKEKTISLLTRTQAETCKLLENNQKSHQLKTSTVYPIKRNKQWRGVEKWFQHFKGLLDYPELNTSLKMIHYSMIRSQTYSQ